MEIAQHILVYAALVLALGYLLRKFVLPKSWFKKRKGKANSCGNGNCGCH